MGPELTADLSRRERQIMDVLFALGQATVNDILRRIPNPPSYSAVRATLRTLVEKGHAEHLQDGPRYLYRPVVARESARSLALGHLVQTFFNGSAEAAAAALLGMARRKLTDDDLRRLAEQVEAARDEGR
ncbi:MAG TPA: BlaI/MecI/CopY family transcriptional regulator [Longimicrobium sp.]|jgi:predicted transcriptional regulator|uniref:BlaI/MecI/CopY family transcriptional regulator n=1 Tax=Longimicrobium sp. TaxID=2029185 RepID=UPI002ED82F89